MEDDLEWKVMYVGQADNSTKDQVLDEILVGPVPVGINKFILQADAPDTSQIPESDILGVTVVLVTCSYREKEFVRIGYYVNNEYAEPYDPEKGPPSPLDVSKVRRAILAEKPRVTRFPIQWGDKDEPVEEPPAQTEAEGQREGSVEGQMLEEAKGMALDDMVAGDDAEEYEEEEDDVSVEGRDMMMDDVAMGNSNTAIAVE